MDNSFEAKNSNIYIHSPHCFNLTHTFECGQCFRWNRREGGYDGVAFGRHISIDCTGEGIISKGVDGGEFEKIWRKYFDFDTDYAGIQRQLSGDEVMQRAIPYGSGIRILNQEPFEVLISFIISQNNNIPRIKLIIERFCALFGEEKEKNGVKYFTFPTAQRLRGIEAGDIAPVKAGFRDKYIADAVKKVNSGEIDLEYIRSLDSEDAR